MKTLILGLLTFASHVFATPTLVGAQCINTEKLLKIEMSDSHFSYWAYVEHLQDWGLITMGKYKAKEVNEGESFRLDFKGRKKYSLVIFNKDDANAKTFPAELIKKNEDPITFECRLLSDSIVPPKSKTHYLTRTDLGIPFRVKFEAQENLCQKYYRSPYTEIFKKNGFELTLAPSFPLSQYCWLNDLHVCKELYFSQEGDHLVCDSKAIGFDGVPLEDSSFEKEICRSEMKPLDVRNIDIAGVELRVKKDSQKLCTFSTKDFAGADRKRIEHGPFTQIIIRSNALITIDENLNEKEFYFHE